MSEAERPAAGMPAAGPPDPTAEAAAGPFVDVGEARRLREGGALPVVIDGRAVVVFRSGGRCHAVSDRCPHNGLPLRDGCVKDGLVTCRWHGWQFDLVTGLTPGAGAEAGGPAIRVYATREEAGRLLVGPPRAAAATGLPPATESPPGGEAGAPGGAGG